MGNFSRFFRSKLCTPLRGEWQATQVMPACFPAALRYVMTRFGFTQEALAFESKVSESTIGRYRNGKVESFSEKNVVALCVAMHLPPWLSFALIAKAGFSLAATKEQLAHLMILNCMYMRSIDEVNEYLRERGNASLSRETAQDCRASWDSEPKMMSRVFNSLPEKDTRLICTVWGWGQEEPDANLHTWLIKRPCEPA